MITINQVVSNKKGSKGTITSIITKSTGYVEVTYENGSVKKEMAFNLTDENGIQLKKTPKSETTGMSRGEKKRRKDAIDLAAFEAMSPIQQAISKLQWINNLTFGDRKSTSYQIIEELYARIEIKAEAVNNTFILSVCNTVIKSMQCSDKQAYCLAKFSVENQIKL